MGAVGLPAFLSERHKSTCRRSASQLCAAQNPWSKLADGCRKSRERHIETRGNHIHGTRAVQADGMNGVDF